MPTILSQIIVANRKKVIDFLSNPYHLKQWTIHRHLYLLNGECYEASEGNKTTYFTKIEVVKTLKGEKETLRFLWTDAGKIIKFFDFEIKAVGSTKTSIEVKLPTLPPESTLKRLERLLRIEFLLLEKILNEQVLSIKKEDALFMEYYLQQLKK